MRTDPGIAGLVGEMVFVPELIIEDGFAGTEIFCAGEGSAVEGDSRAVLGFHTLRGDPAGRSGGNLRGGWDGGGELAPGAGYVLSGAWGWQLLRLRPLAGGGGGGP